jgi:uncharacterized protein YcbX
VGDGEAVLDGANTCVRCTITTIDQTSSEGGKEPLKTLAQYRRTDKGIIFGRNFVVKKTAKISVGDEVTATW